jgi:hypothetical protein
MAWSGYKTLDNRLWAKRLFIFSFLGIIVLSVMMAVDATIPGTSSMKKESQRFTFSAAELPVFGHVGDDIDCNDNHGMYLALREDEEKNLPGSAAKSFKNYNGLLVQSCDREPKNSIQAWIHIKRKVSFKIILRKRRLSCVTGVFLPALTWSGSLDA